MSDTTALLLLGLILLVTLVVAARAYMAFAQLMDLRRRLAERAAAIDGRTAAMSGRFAELRSDVAELDVRAEAARASLGVLDGRLERVAAGLRAGREWLDGVRTRDLVGAENLLARARTALRLIKAAMSVRRTLWG